MKRLLYNTLSALSLLLMLAVAAMWVRSYWFYDCWVLPHSSPFYQSLYYSSVEVYRGGVDVSWIIHEIPVPPPYSYVDNTFAGFSVNRQTLVFPHRASIHERVTELDWLTIDGFDPIGYLGTRVAFPAWFLFLASAILPALWLLASIRRRRRDRTGLCIKCGYDLRASRERCPECGEAIPPGAPIPQPPR